MRSEQDLPFRTWQAMVAARAQQSADRTAITDDHGDSATYGELHDRAAACAAGWQQLGIGPGDVVAVLGRNSIELIVQAIGISATGALPLMLNWRLTVPELASLGGLAQPTAVVADRAFTDGARAVCPSGRHVILDAATDAGEETSGSLAAPYAGSLLPEPESEVFALLHTSGTTGLPRVIPLTHEGHIWGCTRLARMVAMSESDVHLRFTPLFHLAGLQEIFSALLSGGRTILRVAFDPDQWLRDVEEYGATFGHLPPVTMRRVLESWRGLEQRPDLSTLKEVWYGTAPATPEMVAEGLAAFGCGLRQVYGMTEAQSPVTMLLPADHEVGGRRLASAGRPLPEWEVRLVDGSGVDVADGTPGEILLRGRQLFSGYRGPRGVIEPAVDADGWYSSGDIGRFEDGFLHIVDRAKDMIVTGGENVYPAEVEAVLSTHPDVVEAAVVGRPSEQWGEQVHAVLVLRPGAAGAAERVVEHARTRLAGFKVPRSVETVEELPRNASGKVLKRELRQESSTTDRGETA